MNESDLDEVLSGKPVVQPTTKESNKPQVTTSESSNSLRKLLEGKLATASKQLEATNDVQEQSNLLDLISKYLETLQKLNKKVS